MLPTTRALKHGPRVWSRARAPCQDHSGMDAWRQMALGGAEILPGPWALRPHGSQNTGQKGQV